VLPPEELIYSQLAEGYSAVEVASFFEADSMQIIALSFAALQKRRQPQATLGRAVGEATPSGNNRK